MSARGHHSITIGALDGPELDAICAGLRLLHYCQSTGQALPVDVQDLLTRAGTEEPLTPAEMEALLRWLA